MTSGRRTRRHGSDRGPARARYIPEKAAGFLGADGPPHGYALNTSRAIWGKVGGHACVSPLLDGRTERMTSIATRPDCAKPVANRTVTADGMAPPQPGRAGGANAVIGERQRPRTPASRIIDDPSCGVSGSRRIPRPAKSRKPLKDWWAVTGSNRRPSPCKGDALPTELTALPVLDASESRTGRGLVGDGRPARQGPSCFPSVMEEPPEALVLRGLSSSAAHLAPVSGRRWWPRPLPYARAWPPAAARPRRSARAGARGRASAPDPCGRRG